MGWIAGVALAGVAVSAASSGYQAYASDKAGDEAMAAQKDWQNQLMGMQGQFQGPGYAQDLMDALYSGEHGDALIDFLTTRLPLSKAEKQHSQFFNKRAGTMANEGAARLESLMPYADELVKTGFPTDLESIIRGEQHRLLTETAPSVLESRGHMLGLGGSGMADLLQSQASDMGIRLGELGFQRDEAATQRRMQGLGGLAQDIYTGPSNFLNSAFGTIGQQGELGRVRRESVREGAAPPVPSTLDYFTGLAGVEQGQIFPVQPGQYAQGGGGGYGAAAASGISSLLSNPAIMRMLMGSGGGGSSNLAGYNLGSGYELPSYYNAIGSQYGGYGAGSSMLAPSLGPADYNTTGLMVA